MSVFAILLYITATLALGGTAISALVYQAGKRKGLKEGRKLIKKFGGELLATIDAGECFIEGPTGRHWLRRYAETGPLLSPHYFTEETKALADLPQGKLCRVLILVSESNQATQPIQELKRK